MPASPNPHYHALPPEAVLALLDTDGSGLTAAEAGQRLQHHGPNSLPEPPRRPAVLRFLSHFNNVLIHVLIVSAIIAALLDHWIDSGVILAVVLANAIIGFIQEGRAEQAMAAIRDMLAPHTAVLRDGRRISVDASDLVPGDLVLLEAGDRVPADLRLLEARGLRLQEAILTGESVPVDKHVDPVAADVPLGDRTSVLFSGTLVAAGTARGVVTGTGAATEIGRISGMIAQVEKLTTPLVRQMDLFARWLTVFILLVSASLLGFGYLVGGMPFDELFMVVVGLAVAAIPEGLPAVLTITLAVGVQAMARRNAIVRRLPAIETLGSVSVICSDKTGTLTRNEMMAAALVSADRVFTITGEGYAPHGALQVDGTDANAQDHPILQDFCRIASLCNDAHLHPSEDGWQVEGDPMEGALLALAGKLGCEADASAAQTSRIDAIPFDAAHRYMAVLSRLEGGEKVIHVKGAPEAVLDLCDRQAGATPDGAPLDLPNWHARIKQLAAQGQRVIAMAQCAVPPETDRLQPADIEGKLMLTGLVGLIDPPRPEAVEAVAECHSAGIRVKMITGDHAETARAISARIGLRNTSRVLTGADLEKMDDAQLAEAALHTDIFARTSPQHKLRLVNALQARGLTVAMTGDGVNDAPALKQADAGIAMGRKGSEAAKEAAELVLADDNFASIAAAVREGRTVYDNIKKVISWTLPTNGGESMVIILALLLGMTLPVTAVQILWVNLITASTLGIALAFEPSEPGTMRRPPRPRGAPLLDGALVWQVIFVSTLFAVAIFGIFLHAQHQGYPDELAQTMAVNTLVVLEIFYLFLVRNLHGTSFTLAALRGTPAVWYCIVTVTLAQFAFTYLPVMQAIFGTQAVSVADGFLIVAVGVVFLAVVEAEKQMRLAFNRSGEAFSG